MAIRGKSFAFVISGLAAVLLSAGIAAAVFPPLYQQPPAAAPAAPPQITITKVDPPVIVTGDPDPVPTVTASTPEPATLITGLMGLMLAGGYAWRKRRK